MARSRLSASARGRTVRLALLAALLPWPTHAMRLSAVEEYATLAQPCAVRRAGRTCTAPAGSVVQVLGQPASPELARPSERRFVRVVGGPCHEHEATVDLGVLRDLRDTPHPRASGPGPSR